MFGVILILILILIVTFSARWCRRDVSVVLDAQSYPSRKFKRLLGVSKACKLDSECESGSICVKHDDGEAGKCMRACSVDADCGGGACGRFTARADAPLVCCPSSQTSRYGGYDYCTQMPEGSACFSDAVCAGAGQCDKSGVNCGPFPDCDQADCISTCLEGGGEECGSVCADGCLAGLAAYDATCAITKAASKGVCTSACDPNDPSWAPNTSCVYNTWCKTERVHKTPTGDTLCCPENTYYDPTNMPESCVSYAVCAPDRIHKDSNGVLHCCPQESYYDAADDVCLPYSRCRGADGKWMVCPTGKKCDPKAHKCT